MKTKISDGVDFIRNRLWRNDLQILPLWKQLFYVPLRFILLTGQAYRRDGSLLHASALTYISLLAFVPVLVLGLTSLRAFGADDVAQRKIMQFVDDAIVEQMNVVPSVLNEENALPFDGGLDGESGYSQHHSTASTIREMTDKVFQQIDSINFAKMGGVGAITLIVSVLLVLGKIEQSFNHIWSVKRNRSLVRKFTDYLSVLIVVPLLLVASSTIPVIEMVHSFNPGAGRLVSVVSEWRVIHALTPIVSLTLLFTFLFSFLPNTNVRFSSSLLGGVFTAIALVVSFKVFAMLQVGIGNNSILYGSLAAFPIVLFWLHTTWQIILLGAELSFVHQHRENLLRSNAFTHPSQRDYIMIALSLCIEVASSIYNRNEPMSIHNFAHRLRLPKDDLDYVVNALMVNKIIAPVYQIQDVVSGYILSYCATRLRVVDIIRAFVDNAAGENVRERVSCSDIVTRLDKQLDSVLDAAFSLTIDELIKQPAN